jgi:carboxymethylenebutenolidase
MHALTLTRPDGKTCEALAAEPASPAGAPGLVLIQEWWGINDQIKGVAEQYAAAGFRVIIPDLYRGKVGLDHEEAEHLMKGLDFADAATQDIRAAVLHLRQSSARVGVTGYCMGGALTLLTAVFVPDIDAAVVWYGFPPLEYVDASRIKAPVLGHFAIDDAFFPIAMVDTLEEKLRQAGVTHTIHRYQAQHAFANETNVNKPIAVQYDASAAALAWDRTLAFLHQHLGTPGR